MVTIGISQLNVNGKVYSNENNEPIIGAFVLFHEINQSTITDELGNFKVQIPKAGKYLIEIKAHDFKSIVVTELINKDTTINFILFTSVNELNEVVITGVSHATEIKQTPIIIKTIDNQYLKNSTSSNIIDALANVPGISTISTGPAISKPVIRGLGYNRIITLNNGIRQEGQQWGDEHGIEIDEFSIDKVEIIKGPGSLMYGSDGIAGVLNFIAPQSPPKGKIETNILTNFQSNNQLLANSVSNAGSINNFQWQGRITKKIASNFQNKYDGKVLNSGFDEMDGNLFLGINKNWGHSYLRVNSWNNILNLPEGERDSNGNFIFQNSNGEEVSANKEDLKGYKVGFPHQKINHLSGTLNNYFQLNKSKIYLDLGLQNNKRREFGDPTNTNEAELFFDLSTINYNLRYCKSLFNKWETAIGSGGMYQSNTNKGAEFLIPNYNLFDIGVFVTTSKKLTNKFNFAGGIRYDKRTINTESLYLNSLEQVTTEKNENSFQKFDNFTKNFEGISGSLGTSIQITKKQTLKINFSKGYRAPNIAEITSNGKHEGSFRYEIGNKDLKSENSYQFDLAYFYNSDHFSIEFSPYINQIQNYVYIEKLVSVNGGDSIIDLNEPTPTFKFTQGNAILYGSEIFSDIHPHPLDWLHIENSFSFVRAIQLNQPDSLSNLPFIPAPKYKGELRGEWKNHGKRFIDNFIKLGITYTFAQNNIFWAYQTETTTKAYTILNLGIGTILTSKKDKEFAQIIMNVENLMDTAYQNHLSRLKYAPTNITTGRNGIYNMGRNISLKVIFKI